MALKQELNQSYRHDQLPAYLRDILPAENPTVRVLDLETIQTLGNRSLQYGYLSLLRHCLTEQIMEHGLHPPLLLSRAEAYAALGYDDMAAADAFVAYTLCETIRTDEWVSDLEPVGLSGESWAQGVDGERMNLETLCNCLAVLCRALARLGPMQDAKDKFDELFERFHECYVNESLSKEALWSKKVDPNEKSVYLASHASNLWHALNTEQHKFAWSRREIYPWNDYEPDRNSSASLTEINTILHRVAPHLSARVSALPALNGDGSPSEGIWHQLGLFAAAQIPPTTEILREKSLITAIRPLDDALCEACGADLESVSRESMRQCPGEDCDTTYCSEDCATRASREYHNPNVAQETDHDVDEDQDTDLDYPPPHAPFCGNAALHEIGRTASTITAEWDLHFLLLTRTIQTATTQQLHPLALPSIKYLWGDFNPTPPLNDPVPTISQTKRTLPWSLHHNLTLPLQYFETLMHSVPEMKPYSKHWLENYDWWIQSTLVAKFRGVANAQQSTFDGKPEIAAVHPMWCLANHSCEPNVSWTPTGERVFKVRGRDEVVGEGREWDGIKEGDEIWSHYTDIRLPVNERRERLMEVLGGVCKCPRCLREAGEIGES